MNIDGANAGDRLERIQATTDHLLQRSENGWIVGHFFNNRLSSVFQPVFEANTRNVAGHAAYIRSESDRTTVLSPWSVFALASEDAHLVKLDRLCRTIHAINYFTAASGQGVLFVSVQPRLLESVKDDHGHAFKKILDLIEVKTSRVMIEIPIEVNRDSRLLKRVIGNYRSHGYQVAVNHSGTKENWRPDSPICVHCIQISSGWRLPPCCHMAGTESVVDAIRRLGASILVHEIETEQQMMAAINAGADFLQGRLLGMPRRAIEAGRTWWQEP